MSQNSVRMPVLFLGHGSPMNAVESNEFTMGWSLIGAKLPRPKAILCISAHWETRGTWVTAMQHPRTIHDFGGFPAQLYDIQYPAPGSPELAQETTEVITTTNVGLDRAWGLDHGCWSVIKHLYPLADIPVIQMSLDHNLSPLQHYELAKELSDFRNKEVLIVGSGNMVHNLGMVAWDKVNAPEYSYDWAMEASATMKKLILAGDHKKLIHYEEQGRAFKLAIPTAEHYLPLIYALALQEKGEETRLFNDKAVMGSLTMTSVVISGT